MTPPNPLRYASTLLLAVLLVTAARGASTAKTPSGKVLGLQVQSEALSGADRKDLYEVLRSQLDEYPDLELLDRPDRDITEMMLQLECIELNVACMAKLGEKHAARFVTQVGVSEADGGFELRVRVVHVEDERVLRDETVTVGAATELASALETELGETFGPPPPPPKGTLKVRVSQASARIQVDGEMVGTGRVSVERRPGDYTVRVALEGYEERSFEATVRSNETTSRSVELQPIEEPKPAATDEEEEEERPFFKTWWFWTGVGAVVAGGTAGAAAAAADSGGSSAEGGVVLSVEPEQAWRDPAIEGGQP